MTASITVTGAVVLVFCIFFSPLIVGCEALPKLGVEIKKAASPDGIDRHIGLIWC
jgi:hypothetical protein